MKSIAKRFLIAMPLLAAGCSQTWDSQLPLPTDDSHLASPQPPGTANTVTLDVTVCLLDVYHDGDRWGSGTWTTWVHVGGSETRRTVHPIWNRQGNVSDDCTRGSGPNGDKDFCRYNLFSTHRITLKNTEELRIKFGGLYAPRKSIPDASLVVSAQNNWGVDGNGHQIPGFLMHRLGAFNDRTEYYVFINIKQVQ